MKKKEKKEKNEKENLEVVKVKEKKSSHEILKKFLSRTSYTIILLAIIIAAYIGVNLLIEKLNITDIDFTADKVYTLSDTSKQIVKGINQDVKIILVNMNEIQSVIDFSNQYRKENDKIEIEQIDDVNKYPELKSKYNLTDEDSNNRYRIIMQCGDKDKVLTIDDLYTVDYTTYQEKDLTEEAMTNALLDVTITKKPKLYFLTGHNTSVMQYLYLFKQELTNEANEVEDLNLLTKTEVPEDCSALVITTLDEDITTIEKDAIIKYIKKGGKIIIFSDANILKTKMPNFQKVLDEYGISISEGIMIEQDADKMLTGAPSAIIVTVNQGTSITKNINMSTNACFIDAARIDIKDSEELEKLGVEVETLATTSEEAFYRSDLSISNMSKQKTDEEGMATVGALLTKKIDDEKTSKLIVYSNNMFITDVEIAYNLYAIDVYQNKDLALNSISYLTQREDTIMIRKDVETTTYTITQEQQNIILIIIFAVPVAIIVMGIVVWQIRRRKK